MESYGAAMVIVWILGIILAIMALLMPVYVYQIRNKALSIDKKLATIIDLLSGQKGQGAVGPKIKICPLCGAKNRAMDHICIKCGKAMGL